MYDAREDARDERPGLADDPRSSPVFSREREGLRDRRRPALERERDLGEVSEVGRMARHGLTTARASRAERERCVALTRRGARRVRRGRPTREQAVHAGFARHHYADRRLRHDAAVYRACRAETARQGPGGRLTRISLDVELRAEIQSEVARRERELARHLTLQELAPIAERYQLGLTPHRRILYPDAQLEFERDDRNRHMGPPPAAALPHA